MNLLIKLLISTVAVLVAAYFVPGIGLHGGIITGVKVAVVLGLLNTFVKPVLSFLALPLTVLTLGLFKLVITGAIVLLADYLLTDFSVSGFISALIFSLVVAIVSYILDLIF